ncbi:hypothetical protein EMCRGX_G009292 [Ephydatia muelleri]
MAKKLNVRVFSPSNSEPSDSETKEALSQPKLSFPSVDPLTQQVTRAEVKLTNFLVQHNIPFCFAILSQTTKLQKHMQVAEQKPFAYLIMRLLHTSQLYLWRQ